MKKCRKWEPIAHSATVAILFPHLEIRMIEKDRYTALPGRCHIRLRNKFACDVVVLCARVVHERWRGVRADRNVHGMATTPTAADRVSPARRRETGRRSTALAPSEPAHPRTARNAHQQVISAEPSA